MASGELSRLDTGSAAVWATAWSAATLGAARTARGKRSPMRAAWSFMLIAMDSKSSGIVWCGFVKRLFLVSEDMVLQKNGQRAERMTLLYFV